MNRIILALLAAACASPAWSAEYFTSYVSTLGTPTVASLWFTTNDALNSYGGYDIISAHGSVGNDQITGLVINPNQPGLGPSPTGFTYNNVLYGGGPLFDNDGAVFRTAAGFEYNIWSEPDLTYTLASHYITVPAGAPAAPRSNGNLTPPTPTPPLPAPQVVPTHPVVLTFDGARAYRPNVISTQGFEFVSDGLCCAYPWGLTGTNANNGTQRIIYTLHDLTMTTMDDSAFTVTSLDFGTGGLTPEASRYLVLLTGTRADGSTVTSTLDVGNSFATYALTGFSDIVSLVFGHTEGPQIYLTFDNIAVGPSVVPEPATWALLIAGFGMVGHVMRRRRALVARA